MRCFKRTGTRHCDETLLASRPRSVPQAALAAETAARADAAAAREELAALALERARQVRENAADRDRRDASLREARRETDAWRERFEASERSRRHQRETVEGLRGAETRRARLAGRAEALEERLRLAERAREEAERRADAADARADRLERKLEIALEEADLLRAGAARQHRDRDRLVATLNRTDNIVYGDKARTPRARYGSADEPKPASRIRAVGPDSFRHAVVSRALWFPPRSRSRAAHRKNAGPVWKTVGPLTRKVSTRKHGAAGVGRAVP